MKHYQYRAVPAPSRTDKIKGLKTSEERLARSFSDLMNRMAAEGWEYLRADTLPCEERKGLLGGRETRHHVMLVFRRAIEDAAPGDMAAHDAPAARQPSAPASLAAVPEPATPTLSRADADEIHAPPRTPVLRAEKPAAPVGRRLFATSGLGNQRPDDQG